MIRWSGPIIFFGGVLASVVMAEPGTHHWSYEPAVRPELPAGADARHPVDAFVVARLAEHELELSKPAEPEILLRRLSLSLIGLPPTIQELDAFLADYRVDGERAVLAVVDYLLASPQFGERWARPWLDAARYADSHGFQRDDLRDLWPFRDWVIRSLNDNKPFDEFTIEQIAGDLLVKKTKNKELSEEESDLLIATGFHRCSPTNVEAGTDQEEGRVNQVFDRVNTTATVWLGLTLECAQCHDHKYDPFTMRDYYSVFAFFNNTPRETALLNEKAQASLRFTGPYHSLQGQEGKSREANRQTTKKGGIRHRRRTLVMQELTPPRVTHILKRGSFLEPGEAVPAGTPALFEELEGAPRNRLGLAQWLVSEKNPLTGRVIVNRLWAELFGRGIVSSHEDFGVKCDPPTHPELLDWLAVEFVESGWNLKHILRLIVTSKAFQQSACGKADSEPRQLDAANKLLWHFPRRRLDAEAVRDNALAIAGLLSRKQYGPPIRPPQPDGLWRKVGGENYNYQPSEGEDRYRRGLYIIRRRSAPHPSFAAFDASARTACAVKRHISNTPLQALSLLSDPTYLEAATALADRLCDTADRGAERLSKGFRMCTSRFPEKGELEALRSLLEASRSVYDQRGIEKPELQAWIDVATVLLNLDETISIP